MGQPPSKEYDSKELARLEEIRIESYEVGELLRTLRAPAAAEAAAGTPAAQGIHQARWHATWRHYKRLRDESVAIHAYLDGQRAGRCLPLPGPTPPFQLPPLPEPEAQIAPEPASVGEVQPGTPLGSPSSPRGHQGGSNGREEGAQAGVTESSSEAMPLLAGGSGGLAAGLRRRQGHHESG